MKQYGKAARKAQMKQRVDREHACTEATKIAREKQLKIDDTFYLHWERHRMGWPWQLEISGFASSFMEDPFYTQCMSDSAKDVTNEIMSFEMDRLKKNLYQQFAQFCVDKGMARFRDDTRMQAGMTMHTLSLVADFYPDRRRINWPEDTSAALFESRRERLNEK